MMIYNTFFEFHNGFKILPNPNEMKETCRDFTYFCSLKTGQVTDDPKP